LEHHRRQIVQRAGCDLQRVVAGAGLTAYHPRLEHHHQPALVRIDVGVNAQETVQLDVEVRFLLYLADGGLGYGLLGVHEAAGQRPAAHAGVVAALDDDDAAIGRNEAGGGWHRVAVVDGGAAVAHPAIAALHEACRQERPAAGAELHGRWRHYSTRLHRAEWVVFL